MYGVPTSRAKTRQELGNSERNTRKRYESGVIGIKSVGWISPGCFTE